MADETVLSLLGLGVPPYSARGLTQTLEPLDQATSLAAHDQWRADRSVARRIPQIQVDHQRHRSAPAVL